MTEKRGLLVGVTGGVACGKSAVGHILKEMGVPVCEADELAHRTLDPGGPAYKAVTDFFGPNIVQADGGIDRKRLADIVFNDAPKLAELNNLVHPHVRAAWRVWVDANSKSEPAVVVIVPLLFEVGADAEMDAVVCVTSPDSLIHERAMERGWTQAQTVARQAAQMNLAEKVKRSKYVIVNKGSWADLEAETRRVWNALLSKEMHTNG